MKNSVFNTIGHTYTQNIAYHNWMRREITQIFDMYAVLLVCCQYKKECRRCKARDQGAKRRTRNTHLQPINEGRIEGDIHNVHNQCGNHRYF